MRDQTIGAGSLPAGTTKRVSECCRTAVAASTSRHPGTCTFADDARSLAWEPPGSSRQWWSRPMHADGCSMVARMPRYAPAASGIRSTPRMSASRQNGSSRHALALSDSSSERVIEQRSGLLIRGFGVQVPGGAPVLTWGFIAPGHFLCVRFVPVFRPCWLRARSAVGC